MMASRERVLAALEHKEPDRLPMFRPNMIDMFEPLDPGLQQYLDSFSFDDFRGVGGIVNHPSVKRELGDGLMEDGYGCRYQYKGVGLPYCVHSPLAAAESVADVERFPWPDLEAPDLVRPDARECALEIRGKTDHFTAVGVAHLFHTYQYLRGFEQHLLDIKLDPAIHEAIADHIHHINLTLTLRLMEQVGDCVDVVVAGDDFGHSTAPYCCVADFRRFFLPYYADMISRLKSRWPHIRFYLHSHGQIMDFVPDLIDAGVDILNPILPLDHMDPVVLKREYGDRLSFEGGIDIERIVPFGTVEDVQRHVRQVIDILAPSGGYLFKAQAISRLMPPENVIAAYETALEWGQASR